MRNLPAPSRIAAWTLFPLLAAAMFPEALVGTGTFFHYDTWMQNLTFRAWWFDALRDGHFATWCPGMFAGYPLFAETQTGPLYPPTFVLFLLLPATLAFSWSVILHFAFAGLGTYLAARRFGVGRAGAIYAGVAFELSGFLVTHVVHFNLLVGAAWTPWVALLAAGAARGNARETLGLAGAFAALFLGSHPYATMMNAGVAGAVALAHVGGGMRRTSRSLVAVIGAGGLGALVAAVQILPTRAFLPHTTRGEAVDWSFLTFGSFPPWNVFTLAAPNLYGTPADGSYWGSADWSHYAETCAYVGLSTLALAVVAVILRRDRATLLFAAVTAVFGLLMLGRFTPLYRLLTWVPLLDSTRLPGRFALPVTFAVTMLAGLGLDAIPRATPRARRLALLVAALVVIGLGAGAHREGAESRAPSPELAQTGSVWPARLARIQQTAKAAHVRLAVVSVGTLALLLALQRDRRRSVVVSSLAIAWVAGDLVSWGRSFNPTLDPSAVTARPPVVEALGRVVPEARPRPRVFRQGVDEEWVFREGAPRIDLMTPGWSKRASTYRSGAWTLPPNSQLLYGVDSGEGFTSLLPRAWLEWMGLGARPGATPRPDLTEAQADLLSIDAVISTGSGIRGDGWETIDTGRGDVWLSRNVDPLPRVRIARSWVTMPDRPALLERLQAESYNPREGVLLEAAPPGRPRDASGGPVDVAVPARETGPGQWEVRVPPEAGGDALVILSESYDPDWRATGADGREIPVFRADGLFVAFVAPPGGGTVRLRHAPSSLPLGAALSLVGLAVMVLLARRARSRGPAPRPVDRMQQPVSIASTSVVTTSAVVVVLLSLLADVGDVRTERASTSLRAMAARNWMEEASAAFRVQAFDPAIALLRAAARTSERDAVIRYRLGLVLREAGREPEARREFERALDLDPTFEAASRALGTAGTP